MRFSCASRASRQWPGQMWWLQLDVLWPWGSGGSGRWQLERLRFPDERSGGQCSKVQAEFLVVVWTQNLLVAMLSWRIGGDNVNRDHWGGYCNLLSREEAKMRTKVIAQDFSEPGYVWPAVSGGQKGGRDVLTFLSSFCGMMAMSKDYTE